MYKMKCSCTLFLLYARQTTLANRKPDVAEYAYTSFRNSKGADNGQMLHETFRLMALTVHKKVTPMFICTNVILLLIHTLQL